MADKLSTIRRELIARCSPALIDSLLDDLQYEKILTALEVEYIKPPNSLRPEQCRNLIDTVIRKGDDSCNTLLQRIRQRDPVLSEALGITAELPLPTQEQSRNDTKPIQPEINGITLCTVAEYGEIIAKEKDIYPIREKCNRKRLALIICNITFKNLRERKGATVDFERMKEILEGLDYNVKWKINLTAEEMRTTLKTFAADSDHNDSDSTFLVLMSHGERDIICGTDFKSENVQGREEVTGGLHVDDIYQTFNNVNCRGLRDKPKIIIIQACRGNERSCVLVSDSTQEPPNIKQEDLEDDAVRRILKERDFICFYATTPDTVSYRHPEMGALFIQSLIDVLKKDAHNLSIEDIFRKVQLKFKDDIQMPTQDRKTLLKKFFLFPGY